MECRTCGFNNPQGMKFCGQCGTTLERVCPECNAFNPPEFAFCGHCGCDLRRHKADRPIDYHRPESYTPKHLAEKILTSRSAIEGERKLVTVLFADVAGFTSMSEKLDPEDVHQIMDGCFRILMDEIHRYEGTVNEFRGDGAMAIFGAPIAHEDHAQRACHASLAIQKALIPYAEKLQKEYGIAFRMRIGLNSGAVVVGSLGDDLRMDYTAQGDTANLAARMESSAEPGKVLVSDNTYKLARDFFQFRPVGRIQIKGKEEAQQAYELMKPGAVETRLEASLARGLKQMVGREAELEALFRAFGKAKAGNAQVVDIVGEAGIGKSRLVYEFNKEVSAEATFLTGTCAHYGRNVSFLPVIEIVKAAFGIKEGMTEEDVTSRISISAARELAPMIPFYLNLLSLRVDDPMFKVLDPEGRKYGTFEAVKNLLLSLSKEKPLVVFLEDVHWIDKISEELFTYFSRCILDHPILMLSAYRPEGSPSWAHGTHYQRAGVETLSCQSSVRLVRNMVGGLPLDPDLEQKIVAKTGGNPFFVEEIVRELLDRGDLARTGDRYVAERPIDQLKIPDTIQGVLSARMDRLSEDLKRTMQVASVIGRDFAFRLLKSITELDEDLRSHLTNLVGLEIVYEKALYPELEYIFKHALTQQVAYESLLKQRRREIHGRIAQSLEELYSERLAEHYEVLAYHYERSGKAVEAVKYLMLAGEKSNLNNAAQAAYAFFDTASRLVDRHGVELDTEAQVRLCQGQARASINMGAVGPGAESLKKAIELSRRHAMAKHERRSLRQFAFLSGILPSKTETEKVLEMGLSRAGDLRDKALESIILCSLSLLTGLYGEPKKAYQMILEAEQMGMESGKPQPVVVARFFRSVGERVLGRPHKTIELTEGMAEAASSMWSLANLSALSLVRGVALAEVGRIEDAMALLNQGIEVCEKFGAVLRVGALYNSLGYCYQQIYQHRQAWKLNLRSEEIAREMMEKHPTGRRLYAEIVSQANVNLMENLFEQGRDDEAWDRIESLKRESKSEDYDILRFVWESRMSCLEAQILLRRNELGRAENLIQDSLQHARRHALNKREGCLLRLLGEVQSRQGESDAAVSNLKEAIGILKDVGNRRQLWQAHASLASAYETLDRTSDARQQWGAAAEVIHNTANGLSDRQLRHGFLEAQPVREILARAES